MASLGGGEILWSDPWLAQAAPELVARLAQVGQARRLRDGEMLYARGDRASGLVGVRSGLVRQVGALADGREVIAGLFPAGAWFGEISLFDDGPRPFDCFAVGPTELWIVAPAQLRALLDEQPAWYRDFARLLCRKLRLAFDHIESAYLPLPVRVARRLLDLAQVYGRPAAHGIHLGLRLSQDDLAAMLGVTRQHVNRVLRGFEREGWVALAPGRITLVARDALANVVASVGDR